jgi:triple functional domain protein
MVDVSGSSSVLKLVDLGDAVSVTRNLEVLPPSNLEFAAPEMVLGQPVGCQTDMWSVGVFIYAFLRWVCALDPCATSSIPHAIFT